MQDYAFTKHRIFQWMGILLALGVIALGYWYYQANASKIGVLSPTGSLTSGLVGYWNFDRAQTDTTVAYDRSSSKYNGTLTNGPTLINAGAVGQAIDLDGSNDYVTMGNQSNLNFGDTADFSISGWFYRDTSTTDDVIISKINGSVPGEIGYGIYIDGSSDLLRLRTGDGLNTFTLSTNTSFTTSQWVHFVAVWDQDSLANTKFYINGQAVSSSTSGTITSVTSLIHTPDFMIGDFWSTGSPFDGKLDEIRVYNRVLTAAEVTTLYNFQERSKVNTSVSQPQGTGRLDSGLAGYWGMDDGSGTSATDSSTNGNTGTLTNGPTWTTGQIGGATDLDGSNDVIDMGDPASGVLDFGSDNFAVSFWMNGAGYSNQGASTNTAVSKRNDSSGTAAGYSFTYTSSNIMSFTVVNGTTAYTASQTTATAGDNIWHHYVGTRIGSNIYLFVDGVQVASTGSVSGSVSSTEDFQIGDSGTVGTRNSDALFDEVRAYNRGLAADEVKQLYSLTSPTGVDTNLKGYWSFNAQDMSGTSAYDRSGVGSTGTLTNSPAVAEGRVGQTLSFDGTDDYVAIGDPAALRFGTVSFSVSNWIKTTSTSAGYAICSYDTNTTIVGLGINDTGQTNKAFFFLRDNLSSISVQIHSKTSVTDGQWHHLVAVRDVATGLIYLYVDGALENTSAGAPGSVSFATFNNWSIGRAGGASGSYFNGSVDETRVYSKALSVSEIKALYDAGAEDKANSSISQPQGTGRLDSGLAGYFALDTGSGTSATDSSTNGNTGTLTNGPAWTTGQIDGAVDFDGSDDYITVADPDVLDIADGTSFTLSGWFNRDTSNTDDTIMAKSNGQAASDTGYNVYVDDSTDKLTFVANDGTDQYKIESVSTFTATGWNHFLIVWNEASATDTKLYINGSPQAATTTGTFGNVNSLANAVAFRLGAESDNGNPFDGKLDDLKLYMRALTLGEAAQLYRLSVPTGTDTGLKGYWSFNGQDVSGTTAYDRSGSGMNGAFNNAPSVAITEGKIGQAVGNTSAGTNFINVSYNAALNQTSTLSLSLWMKNPTSSNPRYIVDRSSYNLHLGDGINGCTTDGIVGFYTGSSLCSAGPRVDDNLWHHIAATYDGTTGRIYIDGVLNTSGAMTNSLNNVTNGLFIGSNASQNRGFGGQLDEVRLYGRELSATEVAALYNQGR